MINFASLLYHCFTMGKAYDLPYTTNTNDFFSKCFMNCKQLHPFKKSFYIDDTIWDSLENGSLQNPFFLIYLRVTTFFTGMKMEILFPSILQFPEDFPEN